MNAATHAVFGVAAFAGTALIAGTEPPAYAYPAAVVAAWLPDVDSPRSRLGKGLGRIENPTLNALVRPLSWALRTVSFALHLSVGHRTVTHSLFGVTLFTLVVWLSLGVFSNLFHAFAAGYASHVLADALNPRGVPLLWPLGRSFRLLPWGIRTGGLVELLTAFLVAALAALEISLVYPGIDGFL